MRAHAIAALCSCVGFSCAAPAAVFRPLPDLPGGESRSIVWGISRDGSTLVGSSADTLGLVAAYWNLSGVHAIENDASGGAGGGGRPFAAFAASADGSTIVGAMGPGVRAFAWNADSPVRTRRLPELAGTTFLNSRAQDVDDSGRYVVGYSHAPDSQPGNPRIQAVTWDLQASAPAAPPPPARGLGYLDPVLLPQSNAVSISGDASKIVGDGRGPGSIVPFSITRDTGAMTPLDLPVASTTDAIAAANHDGSIIVGRLADHGFLWTGEVMLLDALGADWTAAAAAVSDNASVIVGTAQTVTRDDSAAVVWDSAGRIRRLDDLLTGWDIDLTGWRLTAATAVSGDGRTIAGYGINPDGQTQGFVVTVPAPGMGSVGSVGSILMFMTLSRRRRRVCRGSRTTRG